MAEVRHINSSNGDLWASPETPLVRDADLGPIIVRSTITIGKEEKEKRNLSSVNHGSTSSGGVDDYVRVVEVVMSKYLTQYQFEYLSRDNTFGNIHAPCLDVILLFSRGIITYSVCVCVCVWLRASLIRQFINSSVRILPCPVSSTFQTSITGERGFLRILYTPSSSIAVLSPVYPVSPGSSARREPGQDSQSKKPLAKLMHTFPSHTGLLCLAAVSGIVTVEISSSLRRTPSRERNPTIILGTPSKKDWIQNFIILRSKFSLSRSDLISTDVFSSTQAMGLPLSWGFESQTRCC